MNFTCSDDPYFLAMLIGALLLILLTESGDIEQELSFNAQWLEIFAQHEGALWAVRLMTSS